MSSRPLHSRNPLGRLAAWCALFALLLHSVFAPGLMPDLDAARRGELKLVICGSAGAKPLDTVPATDRPGDAAKHPCDYAAFGQAALTGDPAPPAAPDLSPQPEAELDGRIQPAARLAANGARAPPRG